MKYDYSQLREQTAMLVGNNGKAYIADYRVFYPKASWTELRTVLSAIVGYTFNPRTNTVTQKLGDE